MRRKLPATPVGFELPPVRCASIEEGGYEWSVPHRPPPRRRRIIECNARRATLAFVAVAAAAWLGAGALMDATRDAVRRGDAVCLTPRHVWGLPLPAVAFADAHLGWPRLLAGAGKVVARETSSLCPGAPARAATRFERVTVRHVTPPWPWPRTAHLEGERAVCVQHMIELFAGGTPACPIIP